MVELIRFADGLDVGHNNKTGIKISFRQRKGREEPVDKR
jgi:hypothetical protein